MTQESLTKQVAIADLNIGDVVQFYTIDFNPDAEKIETYNCTILDIRFNHLGKAAIKTVKGYHVWHSVHFQYVLIPGTTGRYDDALPSPMPRSQTVRGVSLE